MLHLRDDDRDLLSGYRLRAIIGKYSDHISLPIVMPAEKRAEEAEETAEEETVNQASALWTRPKNEISDQDYIDFYRHITSDYADPLSWVHSKIEGTYEYTLLLFIPARARTTCGSSIPPAASGCTSGGSSSWRTPAS